jgi:hypothetical protein|tara:strand:+ start:3992 stop:4291 length:300 start_codon:yes stop_codon:yes gene_type:complete
MKKCKVCGTEVAEQYDYCLKCINKVKETNLMQDVLKKLEQINWNFGTLVKQQRLFYLFQICEGYGNDRQDVRKRISEYFSESVEKDLKVLKQIKEEQEK